MQKSARSTSVVQGIVILYISTGVKEPGRVVKLKEVYGMGRCAGDAI